MVMIRVIGPPNFGIGTATLDTKFCDVMGFVERRQFEGFVKNFAIDTVPPVPEGFAIH